MAYQELGCLRTIRSLVRRGQGALRMQRRGTGPKIWSRFCVMRYNRICQPRSCLRFAPDDPSAIEGGDLVVPCRSRVIRAIRTALHSVVGATHNSCRFPSTREDASSPTGLPLIYRFRRFSSRMLLQLPSIHWFFCAPSADTALPDSGGLSRAP